MNLFEAQSVDSKVGDLTLRDALGGPLNLAGTPFVEGANDPFNGPFDPDVFSIYQAWETLKGSRLQIARGELLFNTRPISMTNVRGLNDELGIHRVVGTCSFCHSVPGAGSQPVQGRFFDVGISDRAPRLADLPLYTFRCDEGPLQGQVFETMDPGRALVTGECKDLDRFKVPTLRGLAARTHFFHDGSAATLKDVVIHYNVRFNIGLTQSQIADLVAFLRNL
jgi:hypothetical protein